MTVAKISKFRVLKARFIKRNKALRIPNVGLKKPTFTMLILTVVRITSLSFD